MAILRNDLYSTGGSELVMSMYLYFLSHYAVINIKLICHSVSNEIIRIIGTHLSINILSKIKALV